MMKVTNGQVYAAMQAVKILSEDRWPVKTAYWIGRLEDKLIPVAKRIDTTREELIKKHNKSGDGSISESDKNWKKFVPEYNELMEIEQELNITKITLPSMDESEPPKQRNIQPKVLRALRMFVSVEGLEEEDEDEEATEDKTVKKSDEEVMKIASKVAKPKKNRKS